jgi:hypothetical protein
MVGNINHLDEHGSIILLYNHLLELTPREPKYGIESSVSTPGFYIVRSKRAAQLDGVIQQSLLFT